MLAGSAEEGVRETSGGVRETLHGYGPGRQ
jgi:hypothetical protein